VSKKNNRIQQSEYSGKSKRRLEAYQGACCLFFIMLFDKLWVYQYKCGKSLPTPSGKYIRLYVQTTEIFPIKSVFYGDEVIKVESQQEKYDNFVQSVRSTARHAIHSQLDISAILLK
jgi:hypothetical protein